MFHVSKINTINPSHAAGVYLLIWVVWWMVANSNDPIWLCIWMLMHGIIRYSYFFSRSDVLAEMQIQDAAGRYCYSPLLRFRGSLRFHIHIYSLAKLCTFCPQNCVLWLLWPEPWSNVFVRLWLSVSFKSDCFFHCCALIPSQSKPLFMFGSQTATLKAVGEHCGGVE